MSNFKRDTRISNPGNRPGSGKVSNSSGSSGGSVANSWSSGTTGQTGRYSGRSTTDGLTQVEDIFGFGPLLRQQLAGIGRDDVARRSFLSDLMVRGSDSYMPRLQQGVNYALSGPGMTGAGNAARSRAAAFAGNEAQRQETGFQLAAADQLARNPLALGNALQQFLPLMPSRTRVTEQNSGTSAGTGTSNVQGYTPIQETGGGGFCYFTTAACEVAGEADNGPTLTTLRGFRDTWLAKTKTGMRLIVQYYQEAPRIVTAINQRPDAREVWQAVYKDWILPIRRSIETLKHGKALEQYKALMVVLSDLTKR